MSQQRRKLIEVALPLEAINRESAREKSIRYGHPSTLHLWWARRPPIAGLGIGDNRLRFIELRAGCGADREPREVVQRRWTSEENRLAA
jgi:hypothetical protein